MSASAVHELEAAVERAVAAVGGDGVPVRLERPADPEHGDYATAVALQLAKPLRSAPRDIAARIAAELPSRPHRVGRRGRPGLRQPAGLGGLVPQRARGHPRRGAAVRIGRRVRPGADPGRVRVRQPDRARHGRHRRNAAYGDSLARLFEFAGHDVGREYYFNDAGRQIDLFGESLRARARGEEPPPDGYQGEYVAEIAAELALAPTRLPRSGRGAGTDAMIAGIRTTLARFRCSFDTWFLERSLYESGAVQQAIDRVRADRPCLRERRCAVAALVRPG